MQIIRKGSQMKLFLIISALSMSILFHSKTAVAEPALGNCYGILHSDKGGGLLFGGGKGEDEGICVINKSEVEKVLRTCSVGRSCRVVGMVDYCKDSGECTEISRITSVRGK
jgi:hypothetical protein